MAPWTLTVVRQNINNIIWATALNDAALTESKDKSCVFFSRLFSHEPGDTSVDVLSCPQVSGACQDAGRRHFRLACFAHPRALTMLYKTLHIS